MTYRKFPEGRRKSTGITWWPQADTGRLYVTFATSNHHGSYLVVKNEDTDSGLTDRKDRPVVWSSIRTLTLEDGSPFGVVYACADCDYAALHHYQVRPHRNAHRKNKPVVAEINGAVADLKAIIEGAAAAERKIARLTEERDSWRLRAQKAEADLAAFDRALDRVKRS